MDVSDFVPEVFYLKSFSGVSTCKFRPVGVHHGDILSFEEEGHLVEDNDNEDDVRVSEKPIRMNLEANVIARSKNLIFRRFTTLTIGGSKENGFKRAC